MGDKIRVLVADDSGFARKMAIRALEGTEFEVVGEAACDTDAIAKAKALGPAMVLLDVVMPETSGAEALKGILAHAPDTKVIMLSSLGTEETITTCLSLGARTFVQKPFDKNVLLDVMRKCAAS